MVTKTLTERKSGINIYGTSGTYLAYQKTHNYVHTARPWVNVTSRSMSIYRTGDTSCTLISAGGTKSRADSSTVLCCGVPEPDTNMSNLESEASRRAVSSLYSRLNTIDVNIGQNVVESHQVWNSINSNMMAIARCRRMLKMGNFVAAAESLGLGVHDVGHSRGRFKPTRKNVANRWLELQFGWLPLLSDVYTSVEKINQRVKLNFYEIAASGSSSTSRNSSSPWSTPYTCIRDVEEQMSVQVLYKFKVTVTDPNLRDLAQWGLTNPAVLAWELLPYSFVVDWFLPIGNYLSALSATHGLSISGGAKMVKRRSVVVVRYSKSPSTSAVVSGMATKSYLGLGRSPSSLPEMWAPRLQNPLSASHIADSIALITQRLR